jgi:membrane protein YqaA with SNARE-associated domain
MAAWIETFAAWVQSWLGADAGLWGLFGSAFLSATVLPGASEVMFGAIVTAYPQLALAALGVATLGNVLGCLLTYGMGRAANRGWARLKRVEVDVEHPRVQRLRRIGPPALFLSFLPLVGDALVLAAGWLRMPFWASMFWIALGKAARYAALLLTLKGVLAVF